MSVGSDKNVYVNIWHQALNTVYHYSCRSVISRNLLATCKKNILLTNDLGPKWYQTPGHSSAIQSLDSQRKLNWNLNWDVWLPGWTFSHVAIDINPIYPELVHNCTFQLHLSLLRLKNWFLSNRALPNLLWAIHL